MCYCLAACLSFHAACCSNGSSASTLRKKAYVEWRAEPAKIVLNEHFLDGAELSGNENPKSGGQLWFVLRSCNCISNYSSCILYKRSGKLWGWRKDSFMMFVMDYQPWKAGRFRERQCIQALCALLGRQCSNFAYWGVTFFTSKATQRVPVVCVDFPMYLDTHWLPSLSTDTTLLRSKVSKRNWLWQRRLVGRFKLDPSMYWKGCSTYWGWTMGQGGMQATFGHVLMSSQLSY